MIEVVDRQLEQLTEGLQLNSKDRRRVARAMQKLEAKSREEREQLAKQRTDQQEEVRCCRASASTAAEQFKAADIV